MIAVGSASLSAPEGEDVTGTFAEVYKPKRRIPFGAIFGTLWIGTIVVLTILATYFPSAVPFIRDYDTRVKVNGRTQSYGLGPGWTAWWGLEKSSYDVFARCIYGAKVTLTISIGATLIGLIVGGLLGIIAGYFRGWPDRIISVITDSLLALPFLVLAIVLVYRMDDLQSRYSALSWLTRVWSLTLALGLVVIAPIARLVRAQALTLREREFVLASRSLGASRSRIMIREIMPNVIPAMLTIAFTLLALLIAAEAGLAFLGLSVERPATWGKMIFTGTNDLEKAWWATMFPCMMVIVTVISFNLIGDEMARHFDIREAAV